MKESKGLNEKKQFDINGVVYWFFVLILIAFLQALVIILASKYALNSKDEILLFTGWCSLMIYQKLFLDKL